MRERIVFVEKCSFFCFRFQHTLFLHFNCVTLSVRTAAVNSPPTLPHSPAGAAAAATNTRPERAAAVSAIRVALPPLAPPPTSNSYAYSVRGGVSTVPTGVPVSRGGRGTESAAGAIVTRAPRGNSRRPTSAAVPHCAMSVNCSRVGLMADAERATMVSSQEVVVVEEEGVPSPPATTAHGRTNRAFTGFSGAAAPRPRRPRSSAVVAGPEEEGAPPGGGAKSKPGGTAIENSGVEKAWAAAAGVSVASGAARAGLLCVGKGRGERGSSVYFRIPAPLLPHVSPSHLTTTLATRPTSTPRLSGAGDGALGAPPRAADWAHVGGSVRGRGRPMRVGWCMARSVWLWRDATGSEG